MKTLIIIVLTIISSLCFRPIQAKSQSMLTYSKMTNEQIGITALNAVGQNFEIRSAKGKVIVASKIKNNNIFYISIKNLAIGSYSFSINGDMYQQFSIQ